MNKLFLDDSFTPNSLYLDFIILVSTMYTDLEKTVQTYTDHEPNGADFPPSFYSVTEARPA